MDLNDIKKIKALDSGRVAESIELLPDQIRQVLGEARLVKVPKTYARVNEVVVNGMGGSNLGAHFIKSAFADLMKAPLSIEGGYDVPAHVSKNTLYIISSYSGTTEEPLSVYREVKKRGAKIAAITCGGPKNKLEKLMLKDNIPGYIFRPEHNPSGQPRLGLGYSVFGMATIMAKAGLFDIKIKAVEDIIAMMELETRRLRPEANENNAAKNIVRALAGRVPVLVGAEFLAGNLHIARNQINECGKLFASYLVLPDLNHYAMEGLVNPKSNKDNFVFLFFDSKLYRPRVQKRAALTKEVVRKNGLPVVSHELKGKTKLAQACELLELGSWLSYYLGMHYGVDPVKIPWVDWFKKELA